MVKPKERREAALYLAKKHGVSRARLSRLLGLKLSTLSYNPVVKDDSDLSTKIKDLAEKHKRFGHPRLFVVLKRDLPEVNHKKSHRIYKELGLQIGKRKRKKLGTYSRLPTTEAAEPNHIWAIDFMFDYLETGRRLKILNIIDEFSKISHGVLITHSICGGDVTEYLDHLADGEYPKIIRVDQGTEFTSRAMLDWAYKHNVALEFTKVRKPNQVIEAYNSRMRDECLNEHVFFDLPDAREKIELWHWDYNNFNPHSSLGMKSPIEFAKERQKMLAS